VVVVVRRGNNLTDLLEMRVPRSRA
jgi:hypothetical protein